MLSTNKRSTLLFVLLALFAFCATAQAQTSVGVSLYGAFSGTTTANGVQQSPSNSAGGLIELRHISNPILGYGVSYSYNRANQAYRCSTTNCPVLTPALVSANAQQISVNWVPSVHLASFRPFGVLGVGLLLNQPAGNQSNTTSSTRMVYVYGAGLDWGLLPHLGLRFQYRGNLYKSPDLTKLYTSTNAFTQTAEPMVGAYFNF